MSGKAELWRVYKKYLLILSDANEKINKNKYVKNTYTFYGLNSEKIEDEKLRGKEAEKVGIKKLISRFVPVKSAGAPP